MCGGTLSITYVRRYQWHTHEVQIQTLHPRVIGTVAHMYDVLKTIHVFKVSKIGISNNQVRRMDGWHTCYLDEQRLPHGLVVWQCVFTMDLLDGMMKKWYGTSAQHLSIRRWVVLYVSYQQRLCVGPASLSFPHCHTLKPVSLLCVSSMRPCTNPTAAARHSHKTHTEHNWLNNMPAKRLQDTPSQSGQTTPRNISLVPPTLMSLANRCLLVEVSGGRGVNDSLTLHGFTSLCARVYFFILQLFHVNVWFKK